MTSSCMYGISKVNKYIEGAFGMEMAYKPIWSTQCQNHFDDVCINGLATINPTNLHNIFSEPYKILDRQGKEICCVRPFSAIVFEYNSFCFINWIWVVLYIPNICTRNYCQVIWHLMWKMSYHPTLFYNF